MTHYYELRTISNKPSTTVGAEIARHLAVRQDLGTAVVVTKCPHSLISVVRKTWLHLARQLQKQRAGTLNPEEILRLTHTIMHMQRMKFVPKPPSQVPDAQVYFVEPEKLDSMPPSCYTLYLCDPLSEDSLTRAIDAMPHSGMVVNFDVGMPLSPLGLRPKSELEGLVLKDWHNMVSLLSNRHINPAQLLGNNPTQPQMTDDALDLLLNHSHEFLQAANSLRHYIHLALPLANISADQQQMFDAIMRLAHRVQALSPQGYDNYLIRTFGEDKDDYLDSYFLRDVSTEKALSNLAA